MGRLRYCEYPKSAQPKPVNTCERTYSRITQTEGIRNKTMDDACLPVGKAGTRDEMIMPKNPKYTAR